MGLSSIATLSLGLSMSMAGAGRAVIRSLGPGHRQALEQFFPVVPPSTATLTRLVEAGEETAESKNTQCCRTFNAIEAKTSSSHHPEKET